MFLTFAGNLFAMSRLFAVFCFVFMGAFNVNAQNFTIDPDTLLQGTTDGIDVYTDYYIYMHPILEDTLHLSWRLVGNSFPEEWEVALCDYGQCYTGVPNNGSMAPIPTDESGYLKVILNPYGTEGQGRLSFWVFESGKPDDYVTVHFDISTGGVTSISTVEDKLVSVFPNPATQFLIIEQEDAHAFQQAELITLSGRLIRSIGIDGQARSLTDLASIPDGLYLLRLRGEDGVTHTRKIVVRK
jgi:hypothetical protein